MLGWLLAAGCLLIVVGGVNSVVIFISYLFGDFVVVLRFDVLILILYWFAVVCYILPGLDSVFCVLIVLWFVGLGFDWFGMRFVASICFVAVLVVVWVGCF